MSGLTAEQIKAYDALTEERMELQLLLGVAGWKRLVTHCEKTSAYAYEHMAKTDNPTVMAKQVGAWHVAESIKGYPAYRLQQIETEIKLLEHQRRNA